MGNNTVKNVKIMKGDNLTNLHRFQLHCGGSGVFSNDLIMSFTDGAVGWSSTESTVYAASSVKSVSCAGSSPGLRKGWRLPDILAVSGHSLLHYLGWSSARVNYRGAPESCVTKDGRQNTVKLPCPVQQRQEEKVHLQSLSFFAMFLLFTIISGIKSLGLRLWI